MVKILIVLFIVYWSVALVWGITMPELRRNYIREFLWEAIEDIEKFSKLVDKTAIFYIIFGLLVLLLM